MTKATSLTLIALGAILAFAINGHLPFLNVQVAGLVLMATGTAGMLVPRNRYDAVRRRIVRRTYRRPSQAAKPVESVDDYYITADPAD